MQLTHAEQAGEAEKQKKRKRRNIIGIAGGLQDWPPAMRVLVLLATWMHLLPLPIQWYWHFRLPAVRCCI